jgi:hypothetical protein
LDAVRNRIEREIKTISIDWHVGSGSFQLISVSLVTEDGGKEGSCAGFGDRKFDPSLGVEEGDSGTVVAFVDGCSHSFRDGVQ